MFPTFAEKLREIDRSFEIQRDNLFANFALREIYLAMGKGDEAIEAHEKAAKDAPFLSLSLANAYALTGRKKEAEKILKEAEQGPASTWNTMWCAIVNGALGKMDEAYKWLNHKPYHAWIPWITCMNMFKPLQKDPRYKEYIKQFNIPKQ